MSRIYFHSLEGDAEVQGAERMYFGLYCAEATWAILSQVAEDWGGRPSILRQAYPPTHYAHNASQREFANSVRLHLRAGDEPFLLGDRKVDMFQVVLNTAFFMGCNPVKLAARLHGQCEIHAWVDGPNRQWLANIIKEGREIGFYRSDVGWESVITLLEADDTQPVVTSYSVCEQFPNAYVANFEYPIVDGERDTDAWYELPHEEQWRLATGGLWQKKSLEMTPWRWGRNRDGRTGGRWFEEPDYRPFYFGHGMDANQFVAQLVALEKAKEGETAVPQPGL